MRRILLAAALALLFPVAACSAQEAAKMMLYPAPPIYLTWWAQVEDCLGQTRPMKDVRFFVVKTTAFRANGDSTLVWGLYVDESISVSGKSDVLVGLGWEGVAGIVRHEMAHAIRRDITAEHDPAVYGANAKCAPLFALPQYANPADPPH